MTNNASSKSPHDTIAGPQSTHVSGRSLVSQFKAIWRRGEHIDAGAFLARYAGAPFHNSALLDLAYEEYCLRREFGQSVDADEFAAHFFQIQRSLCHLLNVHQFIAANTDLIGIGAPVDWPEVGEDFLGFELVEELGRGAFARVFLAREIALAGREVVVKIAQQGPAEAEIIAKLQHANIIPIYSVGADPQTGLTALCMPFKGRSTLGDLVDRARAAKETLDVEFICRVAELSAEQSAAQAAALSWRRRPNSYTGMVLEIAEQVASAIAYAHGKGICHQDLKPSNVLLGTALEPLILDFNLSADGRSPERIGGTLPYMAPEQLLAIGSRHEESDAIFDPRSDVFAWAVMTWEVLTGGLPFPRGEAPNCWQSLLESRRKPHFGRTLDGEVDRTAFAVIRDCLQFDSALRPTATEVVRRLQMRHRLGPRLARWSRSHPRTVLLGVSGAILLGSATVALQAARPPSSIRHYHSAQAYFREQRFDEAAAELSLSLHEHQSPEALYLRGRIRLLDNDFNAASEDFHSAYKLTGQPELFAARAFCRASAKEFNDAAALGEKAISAGCQSAEIYNNLGFAYSHLRKFPEAIECFDKSVRLNGRLQAPLLNRARVTLNLKRAGRAVDLRQADADINKAAALGPLAGDVLADAARLRILLRPGMPIDDGTVSLLRQAVRNGLDIQAFFTDPIFENAQVFPPASFFADIGPQPHALKLATRLLDPISNDFTVKSK